MSNDSQKPVSADQGIPLADIVPGKPFLAKLGHDELLIIKQDDVYHAVGALCSHAGAPLQEGLVHNGEIRCPWHHARFCLKTGEALSAPAFDPLPIFSAQVDGERLFIKKSSPVTAQRTPAKASVKPPGRVVVIGAGAAGYAFADMLVRLGFNGTLTLVNADRDMPYDRTVCSKDYLAGKMKRSECFLPSDHLFAEPNDAGSRAILLQQTVTAIEAQSNEIILDSGERVAFDALVLATGAEPVRPTAPELAGHAYVLRTLHDADDIIEQAKDSSSVAIVGASFIGLEAAASMRQRKLKVHVVAPDKVPLSKNVGEAVGATVQAVHEQHGIVFHLGRELKSYDGNTVTLDDGSSFDADFLILGTGVKPRTELAQAAGIAVASIDDGGGVIVNRRLETSISGIYAIGDVARYPVPAAADPIRVEHWVHAQRQGQFVARSIMGIGGEFDESPFFWTAHFDLSLRYIGHVEKPRQNHLDGNFAGKNFALTFSDDHGGKALLTCEQDLKSLQVEAAWENGTAPAS